MDERRRHWLWAGGGTVVTAIFVIHAPQRTPATILATAGMVALAIAFFRQTCAMVMPVGRMAIRGPLRAARRARRRLAMPPAVRFLHMSAWTSACLAIPAFLSGYEGLTAACLGACAVLLFVAGSIDLTVRGTWLARRVWNETLGKIFSVSIGAILIAVSVAAAKSWVHSIVRIDAKYFIESTAILAAMILPIAYCLFGVCVLSLYAAGQMGRLAVVSVGTSFFRQMLPFAGQRRVESAKMLRYRLVHGRRPPGGILPSAWRRFFDDAPASIRPVSTLVVIVAIVMLVQALQNLPRAYRPYVAAAVVALDYRGGSSCIGLGGALGVAYMDDGKVSVARRRGADIEFAVERCRYASDAP